MIIKKNGINVSFYLLTPEAKTQSQVYASVSLKSKSTTQRIRFATGESFLTKYCHKRSGVRASKQTKKKELVRKNTTFYMEYNSILDKIRTHLFEIAYTFQKSSKNFTLTDIKNEYYLRSGLIEVKTESFETAFKSFINTNKSEWVGATLTKVNTTFMHLQEFEKKHGSIDLQNINIELWDKLKNEYFVEETKFSNSTSNKYLSFFKQFLRYAKRIKYITHEIDFEQMKYLEEIEPYKIALKINEVEKLIKLNLNNDSRLDKVRDLFYLEIMTGQRFSDIPKLLDKNNITESAIIIYQEKTNEKVNIPLHSKLKTHLDYIFDKYPNGLPSISNQKFNEYLKEICKLAEFNQKHSWVTITGKVKKTHVDLRYNLISSHTGRRTFCTLALGSGINAETIMKVTGHRKYDQFREYVKIDDSDVNKEFNKF